MLNVEFGTDETGLSGIKLTKEIFQIGLPNAYSLWTIENFGTDETGISLSKYSNRLDII